MIWIGVDIGAVQLQIVRHGADGHFLQFLTAADDVHMARIRSAQMGRGVPQ